MTFIFLYRDANNWPININFTWSVYTRSHCVVIFTLLLAIVTQLLLYMTIYLGLIHIWVLLLLISISIFIFFISFFHWTPIYLFLLFYFIYFALAYCGWLPLTIIILIIVVIVLLLTVIMFKTPIAIVYHYCNYLPLVIWIFLLFSAWCSLTYWHTDIHQLLIVCFVFAYLIYLALVIKIKIT